MFLTILPFVCSCDFAHGEEELRKPGAVQAEAEVG